MYRLLRDRPTVKRGIPDALFVGRERFIAIINDDLAIPVYINGQ